MPELYRMSTELHKIMMIIMLNFLFNRQRPYISSHRFWFAQNVAWIVRIFILHTVLPDLHKCCLNCTKCCLSCTNCGLNCYTGDQGGCYVCISKKIKWILPIEGGIWWTRLQYSHLMKEVFTQTPDTSVFASNPYALSIT